MRSYKVEIIYYPYQEEAIERKLHLLRITDFHINHNVSKRGSEAWEREDDLSGIFEYRMMIIPLPEEKFGLFKDNLMPFLNDIRASVYCTELIPL